MSSAEIIPVFLASPGDLTQERKAAREVAEEVNQYVGQSLAMRLEFYGWEQQPPGFGRAQAQINPRVDEAAVFVGLLYRRWGTPPGAGHTSGFDEEYKRAIARREKGDSEPAIWLFFKEVDAGQLADPGAELRKVLDFKARVEKRREVLYRRFKDDAAWRSQLFALFANYLVERSASRQQGGEPDRSLPAPTTDQSALPGQQAGAADPAVAQLAATLESARRAVTADGGPFLPPRPDLARVLLASHTWASYVSAAQVLETHDANFLYRMRAGVEPLAGEAVALMRSMITGGEVRPGWFWSSRSPLSATSLLARLASRDRNAEVRLAALRLLEEPAELADVAQELDTETFSPTEFLGARLDDGDTRVGAEAARLLGKCDSDEALELLRAAAQHPALASEANRAVVRILLRRDPSAALRFVVQEFGGYIPDDLALELVEHAAAFDATSRAELADSQSGLRRELALKIDAAANRLTEDRVREALTDQVHRVRLLAVDLMLVNDWALDEEAYQAAVKTESPMSRFLERSEDHLREVRFLCSLGEGKLRAEINWYLPQTAAHYEALGRSCWETFGEQVRRDLDDNFSAFREESAAGIRARFGEPGVETFVKELDFAGRLFVRGALAALAKHASSDDTARIRRYVDDDDSDIQLEALRALQRVGSAEDAMTAVTVAASTSLPENKEAAASAALALSPDSARALLETGDALAVKCGLKALPRADDNVAAAKRLLNHSDDSVRVAAVAYLVSGEEHEQITHLLDEYLLQESYFYNVVCWLDRVLYAPEPFRTRYLTELDRHRA